MAPKPKKADSQASASGFVAMQKDGDVIEVHPLCVADHKRLGWKEVAEADGSAEEAGSGEADEE